MRGAGGLAFVHPYQCGDMASPARGPSYNDRARTPDGIRTLRLRPGADGAASIQARPSGSNIGIPTLPLVPPVRVQLLSSDGSCWDVVYGMPVANDAQRFRALAD